VKKSKFMPKKSMMIFHQCESAYITTPGRKEGRKDGWMNGWMKFCMWRGNIVLSWWLAMY
jgi:hypothetical protein